MTNMKPTGLDWMHHGETTVFNKFDRSQWVVIKTGLTQALLNHSTIRDRYEAGRMSRYDRHETPSTDEPVLEMKGKAALELHVGRSRKTEWKMPRSDEDRETAKQRFDTITDWITSGHVKVVRVEEGDGFRMFYRTVNGYEFGPEYADDGGIFARVALAVQAAGGS